MGWGDVGSSAVARAQERLEDIQVPSVSDSQQSTDCHHSQREVQNVRESYGRDQKVCGVRPGAGGSVVRPGGGGTGGVVWSAGGSTGGVVRSTGGDVVRPSGGGGVVRPAGGRALCEYHPPMSICMHAI